MDRTVLVVDDSNTMRKSIGFVLKENGYGVVEACDGLDGLRKLDENKVSLILTDVNMPNLDGIEFIGKVRNTIRNRFTPIIVLTTESEKTQMDRGKAAGATGWIVKPFKNNDLIMAVRRVLGTFVGRKS